MSLTLWFLEEHPAFGYDLGEALVRDDSLGIRNHDQLGDAEDDFMEVTVNEWTAWPEDYARPIVALPEWRFAPDFWRLGLFDFASRRLRDALAQPADVVQFLPFELTRAHPDAKAQDYRWMRIMAVQPAMDLDRSDCRIEDSTDGWTGLPRRWPVWIDQFVLLDGLVPRTDIFRMAELPTRILATDALAARVLRAGCTGLEFADPSNQQHGKRIERLRTADGITERKVGYHED